MGMGLEGYDAYSDGATHAFLIATCDGDFHADRLEALRKSKPGICNEGFGATLYLLVINSAVRAARRAAPDVPAFTTEERLEAALMLARMDRATAEESLASGGEYTI